MLHLEIVRKMSATHRLPCSMSGPSTLATPQLPALMRTAAAAASTTATRQKPRAAIPPPRVHSLAHRRIRLKVREIVRPPPTDKPAKKPRLHWDLKYTPDNAATCYREWCANVSSSHAPQRTIIHPERGRKIVGTPAHRRYINTETHLQIAKGEAGALFVVHADDPLSTWRLTAHMA